MGHGVGAFGGSPTGLESTWVGLGWACSNVWNRLWVAARVWMMGVGQSFLWRAAALVSASGRPQHWR